MADRRAPTDGGNEETPLEHLQREHGALNALSYMVGTYVVANGIRDAWLLVDGPDCVHERTLQIQGNHDYLSDLTNVAGFHRVAHTGLETMDVALPREDDLQALLERIGANDEVRLLLMTSMPAATILGIDYGRLGVEARKTTGTDFVHIPGKSLSTDWLGAYQEGLRALARSLPLGGEPAPRDDAVAVVGLLHDRNEEDAFGNVRELRRMLAGIGVELVSTWLSGDTTEALQQARHAGAVISLPYGRRAARSLARRLKVDVIETGLPFGLRATERWLREVGAALGRAAEAEAFIEAELATIVPRLEWVLPFLFHHRRFGYVGDPHLLPGFVETIDLLGAETRFAYVTNHTHHLAEVPVDLPVEVVRSEARVIDYMDLRRELQGDDLVDCVVTNSLGIPFVLSDRYAIVEFGFPSYHVHALHDRPFLGFRGFLAFVDTLANDLRLFRLFRGKRGAG